MNVCADCRDWYIPIPDRVKINKEDIFPKRFYLEILNAGIHHLETNIAAM